jgi:hypothetical protein
VRLHGGDELLHFRLAELEMGKAVALVSTVETVDQSSHFHTIHPGDKDVDATGTESEAADQRKKKNTPQPVAAPKSGLQHIRVQETDVTSLAPALISSIASVSAEGMSVSSAARARLASDSAIADNPGGPFENRPRYPSIVFAHFSRIGFRAPVHLFRLFS